MRPMGKRYRACGTSMCVAKPPSATKPSPCLKHSWSWPSTVHVEHWPQPMNGYTTTLPSAPPPSPPTTPAATRFGKFVVGARPTPRVRYEHDPHGLCGTRWPESRVAGYGPVPNGDRIADVWADRLNVAHRFVAEGAWASSNGGITRQQAEVAIRMSNVRHGPPRRSAAVSWSRRRASFPPPTWPMGPTRGASARPCGTGRSTAFLARTPRTCPCPGDLVSACAQGCWCPTTVASVRALLDPARQPVCACPTRSRATSHMRACPTRSRAASLMRVCNPRNQTHLNGDEHLGALRRRPRRHRAP